MPFRPDIVVTGRDSPEILLVVELRGDSGGLNSTEAALKSYVVQVNCPTGMLVTPEQIRFYRNRYTDYAPQTVETIGECPTGKLLGTLPGGSESDLERPVEDWIESLRTGGGRPWPASVREAIESSVLPAVNGGVVRAGRAGAAPVSNRWATFWWRRTGHSHMRLRRITSGWTRSNS